MIIDVHTHLNNYGEEPVPLEKRLDDLLAAMAKNKVDYAAVLTSFKVSANRPSIHEVVRAARDHKNLLVVAGVSYLEYKERDLREISDYLQAGVVRGLKIYPGYEPFYPYDKRCQVIYDLAVEYDVPMMIHTGDTYSSRGRLRYAHPLNIDDVAVDNPSMKIVMCHMGNPWIRDCMEVVYKNTNVYADISGLVLGNFTAAFERYMREQFRDMIAYAGEPHYLLFGTDWPICSIDSYLEFMRDLRMPAAAKELIQWRNAAKLFRIDTGKPEAPSGPGRLSPPPPAP